MSKPIVAVMARAPSAPGKSRLMRAVGARQAARLREALLRDTLERLAAIDAPKAVVFTPADAEPEVRALLPFPALLLQQRGESLGDRMRAGLHHLLALGYDTVVTVGSDLPTLPPQHVVRAIELIARKPDRVAIGPATDGGYYLLGLTRLHAVLFEDIPWGTRSVLERTLHAAAAIGVAVDLVPWWYDVDSPADLARVCCGSDRWAGAARHTRAWYAAASPAVRSRVAQGRVVG